MLDVPTGLVNSRVVSASADVVVLPSPPGKGSSSTVSSSTCSPPSSWFKRGYQKSKYMYGIARIERIPRRVLNDSTSTTPSSSSSNSSSSA